MNTLTDNSDIDGAKAAVTRAIESHGAAYSRLFTFDGKPINSPEQHTSELARLVQPVESAVAKALEVADKVTADVERTRLNQYADPLNSLDHAQLGLAGQYAPFVKEDCQQLPIPELIGRLEWAGKHPGEYMKVLYRRYGAQRFQSMLDAKPQPDGIAEMRAALEQLGAIGQSRGLSSEAVKRQEAAAALKRWAGRELSIARDPEKDKADRAKSAAATRAMF